MRKLVTLIVAAVVIGGIAAPQAGSAVDTYIVSGPAGAFTNYTNPVVTYVPGQKVILVHADVARHDVISTALGSDDASWCMFFESGECPLFWSPLIGASQQTEVLGMENVVPGETYEFFCSLHSNMVGTLVVLPT